VGVCIRTGNNVSPNLCPPSARGVVTSVVTAVWRKLNILQATRYNLSRFVRSFLQRFGPVRKVVRLVTHTNVMAGSLLRMAGEPRDVPVTSCILAVLNDLVRAVTAHLTTSYSACVLPGTRCGGSLRGLLAAFRLVLLWVALSSIPLTRARADVNLAAWNKPVQGLEVWGAAANNELGARVASAGDVNNDGYQDILIASYNIDSYAGTAYLVFGSPSRSTSIIDTSASMLPDGIKIFGGSASDFWGIAVSGAGDFNEDGIDDFIVGGYAFDPPLRANAGAAVVIFGKTSGWADINLSTFTSGSAGFWILGAAPGDQCGNSVSAAGDVNGDGTDDLIIGAYWVDQHSKVDAGTSYVIFGHSAATAFGTVDLLSFSSGSAGFKILGAAAGDYSGYSVCGAGDVNGDGYGDVLLGAIYYDGPGGSNSGAVYVIFGHSTATTFTDIDLAILSINQGFRITGAVAGGLLGYSMSSAGDFNDDGFGDILIGSAVSKMYVIYGHSTATPFADIDLAPFVAGSAGFVITGGNIGHPCSGGVDVNGDGVHDVALGAYSADVTGIGVDVGVVYVLYGRPSVSFTYVDLSQGLSGVSGFCITGVAAFDTTGVGVALVGDFDGDGIGDVVVGATGSDPSGRTSAGTARLIYGELSAPTSQPSRQPTGQPSRLPSRQPTSQPSRRPTAQPSRRPTAQPSRQPSRQPTSQPSRQPSSQPSRQPSAPPTTSPVGERSGDVDLSTWTKPRQGFEVWGAAAGDELGARVADAGDVNKDGYRDFLIASYSASSYTGAAYLVFGSPSRSTSTIDTSVSMSTKGVKILGASVNDQWGTAVSSAGDFNKDGIDDFIIGGGEFDPPSRANAGGAVVIFGKTSGWADIRLASFTSGSAGFWIWGAAADGDKCGYSVGALGDVNGDGADDLVVGSYGADSNGKVDAGTSYVLFGHSNATAFGTIDLSTFSAGVAGFKIFGATARDVSGYSLSGAGDINGDGYRDMLIGALYYDCPGASDCGAVYVIFGHSVSTAFMDIDLALLTNSQGFRITGAGTDHNLGFSVSSAGDFNRDGYGDFLMGSAVGRAYVIYGRPTPTPVANIDLALFVPGSAGFVITGGDIRHPCSGGVDLNGDGVHDLVLGAHASDVSGVGIDVGVVYVLYGRPSVAFTYVDLSQGLSSVSGFRIVGAAASDNTGVAVALIRDFDGDGVGDVVVGATGSDPTGRISGGTAYLIYGELSAPTSQPSQQPTGQPSIQPTLQPTRQPVSQPSAQPSLQPSRQPTAQPFSQPTSQPSGRPSHSPHRPRSERTGDVNLGTWTKPGQGLEVWGALTNDGAGNCVADAGDVNNDGYKDILIGSSGADLSGSVNVGAVYLVFGAPGRATSDLDTASAILPAGVTIFGVSASDYWGYSVSGIGDFNMDGIDDFVVGAPYYNPATLTDAGAAVVIFGKASGWADIHLASFSSGSVGFWINGAADGDYCSISVSGAGDMNGDGSNDVVIGAFKADPQSRSDAGVTYVLFGHSNATSFGTINLAAFSSGSAGFKVFGATIGDQSGNSVSSAGDVNGDGYSDVIIGARYYDRTDGALESGAAYVLFGHSTTTPFTDIDLAALSSSSQGFRIFGAAASNRIGWAVSSAGDFNHDGYGDVVIGSPVNMAYVLFGHSAAFSTVDLSTFLAGTTGFMISGRASLGYSVSGGTDVNGDGVDDLIIAAPAYVNPSPGIAYVLYGREQLIFANVDVQNGLPSVLGFRIVGATASMSGEWWVSLVRDFDGDGVGDVLIGALYADASGRTDSGTAYLVYGGLSAPTSQPSKQPTTQPSKQPTSQPSRQPSARLTTSPVSERSGDVDLATWAKPRQGLEVWGGAAGDLLGQSVADAGDVNGDGYHDILVGAYTADIAGKADAGAVYLVFGSPSRSTSVVDAGGAMPLRGIKIAGATAFDYWGYSVSGVGDVNTDGIDDFIVGGFGFDASSRSTAGAAVVIFGKTSGWADIDLATFASGSAGFWIFGEVAGDQCGYSVGAAGDFNGDGADDFIIGAFAASPQSKVQSGASYVIFGSITTNAFSTIDLSSFISGSAGFKILGATAGDQSGNRVSGAGDINGDGYSDLILGARSYDGLGGSNCGAAYVIFGHSAATTFTDIDLAAFSTSQGFRITGATASGLLGFSVSGAGDFNHDGYSDIVIGSAADNSYVLFGHASTTAFPNIDMATFTAGAAGFTINGQGTGLIVGGGADVNGDGVDDVVVTAPTLSSTGAAFVLYGRRLSAFADVDLLTEFSSLIGFKISGATASMLSEWSVRLVNDFDGDGVGEILLGTRYGDPPGRTDGGTAYLIYGELSAPTSQPSRQPTGQPSRQPTSQPSRQPSARPTSSPVSEKIGNVDLASWTKPGDGLEVWGAGAGDLLGHSVADAGDVNGDGYHDILLGAFTVDLGGKQDAGAVYLVFGTPRRSTSVVDTASAAPPNGVRIAGAAAFDYTGYSVSGVGDVNSDGFDDFIVGNYGFDAPSRINSGAAVVILGKASGWADIDLASFTSGSAGFWIWGAATGDECGIAVGAAGDVNGDGVDDLVIGAYGANPAGISYVIFGLIASTFTTIDLSAFSSGIAGLKILGSTAGDQSGNRVSGIGDINADGYGDIFIGAHFFDGSGGSDCGAVYVIFGHSAATAYTDVHLSALTSSQGFRITGPAANARLGWSASGAGDFNHDGYDDVVIGSLADKSYVLFGHASGATFPNVDMTTFTAGAAGFTISGQTAGVTVSGGADINGDRVDDIIITASMLAPTGAAYVLYGRQQSVFADINLQTEFSSVTGFKIAGATDLMLSDWSVGLVKDFDGDGVGDVLVGTRNGDPPGRTNGGTAYLIYGELSAPTSQPSSQPSRQPSARPSRGSVAERAGDVNIATWIKPGQGLEVLGAISGDGLGRKVADAGDVNGDGYHDVLISAYAADISAKTDVGAVYLVFGFPGRSTSTIDTAGDVSPKGIKILGAAGPGHEYWGVSVGGTGDINDDGVDDFIIGGYAFDPPSRPDAGAAVVIFGKTSGWVDMDLANFTSGSAGFWIYGAVGGDQCGFAVSGAGDVNGDGKDDFIIGSYAANPQNKYVAGMSYVIFGNNATAAVSTLDLFAFSSGNAGFKIFGATAGDESGIGVSGAGDINSDGFGDVLIAASFFGGPDRGNSGAVYVIFGHGAATAFTDIDLGALASSQGFRIIGAAANDFLGTSVSKAGDFNHDGYDDIVFGSVNKAYILFGHTNTTSFPDVDLAAFTAGEAGFMVIGSGDLGHSVSGGTDINGDGVDDIAVTAPEYSTTGIVYLLYGRSHYQFGNMNVLSGIPSASGYQIVGVTPLMRAYWSVALIRDFDGDGVGDVVVGACFADPLGRTDAGTAYIVYGELSAPSSQPSRQPTALPSRQPTSQPTSQPSRQPGSLPTRQPSTQPSVRPSTQPTIRPSYQPSAQPSVQPTEHPTSQPSRSPTGQPSGQPTTSPTGQPSDQPSGQPSCQPSARPSGQPSCEPTVLPSSQPSVQPTSQPSRSPTVQPSVQPSRQPTGQLSSAPSGQPSLPPSAQPTRQPTSIPTGSPSEQPTAQPTCVPSRQPTTEPTGQPSRYPTGSPSTRPTGQPSAPPTVQPTHYPTGQPSSTPSSQPTSQPSSQPSSVPTVQPTQQPVGVPTAQPSRQPSAKPSNVPSMQPTSQPIVQPSSQPSSVPSLQPISQPSTQPSQRPTMQPSCSPSAQPSRQPTAQPSCTPSGQPTVQPSTLPSQQPTTQPSGAPSRQPSAQPSSPPTRQPTGAPTAQPSTQPSGAPSLQPTSQPTGAPTRRPTNQPTRAPTAQPSGRPSMQPSRQPTCRPSAQPTSAPTFVVVGPATLGCSITVEYVGRTVSVVKAALHGARDGNVRLYAVEKDGGSSHSADATAVALQQDSDFTAHITGQEPAALNVTGLLPFTDYDLYCVATISQGITMQLPTILTTKQSLRTTCCKTITVAVLHPATISLGQEIAGAVKVTTDAPPSASLSVTVGYTTVNEQSAGVQLLPAVLRYDNRSATGASKDVKLTASRAGNYTLVVGLAGPSAVEYTVVYVGARRLTVLAADASPAVPQLLQGAFSNDGSYLTVSFDAATDRGGLYGAFPCRTLLRFIGRSNGNCQWFSDNQLRIYPVVVGAGATVGVGGNVTLLENTVRARCTDTQRAAGQCASNLPVAPATVIVIAPSAPVIPSVVISAPASIGGCNSLTLDLAGSVGSAGRSWDTVSFAVSTTPTSASAADRLLQFLYHNYTLSPPLPVPSTVLAKGYAYSLKVTLCNFLRACGSATKVVSVADTVAPVPVVTIAGQSVRTVYRTDALSVLADAYTQSCSGAKSSAGLQYSWVMTQLLPGASAYTNATLRSTSQNPTVFKLPSYSLTVGAVYTVTVSALSMLSGQRSSAVVQLKVLQSDLVAVLKGGSTRYAMVGEVVTLDASSSYDKDYPQQPLSGAAVSYTWQCLTVAPVLSTACAVTLVEANSGRSRVVNVTSTYTALNTTTVVSVTSSDASRSSTVQVRIIVLQAPSPRLSISAVGSTDNVNTGKPFTLLGSMYLLAPCTAAWSVDDPTIALTTAARTPVQQWTLPGSGAAVVPFNLVIKSDALPQQATLQFTLSCGSTVVSTAVTTNGAPLPGSFSVKPEFGVELSTVFTFAAAQWTDPDLPLTYQFGFQSAVSLSNLVIVSRSEQSYATSSLPAGDVSRASAVDCSLRIFDSVGAFADRATVVLVATQNNADQSSQLVLELLKSSADSVQGMKTALAVGSSVVNAVNCTAAPNCGPLNRQPCRMTSGQCGTCLDGYAGDAGDRNSLCVALTAPPAQLATAKDCAYNCTGHGQCIYVSKTTGTPVTTCTLADTDCDATCACTDHYSGEFCEIDSVTLRRRREVRSNLISSLSNLTAHEDINTESVAAWSANLYALSIRPHEVSQVDAAVLADIANITLHHAIALGVDSYADMLGVLQATDAVASLLRYNYNPNDYRDADFNTSRSYVNNTAARFIPVVRTFGDMVSNLMVLGENETTLSYDNFRMSIALAAGGRIEESHSVPAGELANFPASSVALQTVTGAAVPAVAIKVMSTHPRSYAENTAAYVSSPVRLQVQALGSQQSSAAEYLSSIEFTFQHNEPQYQYVSHEERNFTTTCTARNASQTFAYQCPDSGHVIRHNCSQGAGVHVSYCRRPAAACAMLALDTAEITTPSACIVLNSTATYTTCRCTVSNDLRRSLVTTEQQILDATGATDMLATTVYIASDFADTFSAAGALNNATLSSVLVVVLLLGSVWATGLGILVMEWTWYKWSPAKEKTTKEREGVQSILAYIDSVIPKVFERGTSSVRRLLTEVTQHHVLFQLATADTPAERWFLMMQALTDLTVLFFLTAAFFDISQPGDDGTCPHYTAADSCLKRVCPFDYSQTYCKWVEVGVNTSEGQCMYNNQGMSTTALFFLTVLTTVISSIVSIPIEYQFATLKAPTALSLEGSKVSAVVDTVVSGARRVSNAGLAFFEPARVAPAPALKPPTERGKSFLFKPAGDGVVANREIPASIAEISAAARGSLAVIGRNASTLALGAEGASRALRSRSTRIARRSSAGQGGSAFVKPGSAALRLAEPTTLTAAAAHDNDDGAVLLMQDIVHQRLLMNSAAKETQEFDAQWGVLYDGADTYTVRSEVADCIQTAVNESSKEAARLNDTLSNYSLQHAGLEMLHLFMLDLLGRNTIAAKIFREKFGEEFGHSRVVVRWQKLFAAAALLGLNAFFIYFVMIKGVQKGRNWQEQYVACCIVQVGVDILLFETVECAWLNFLVPQYVHEEVASAAEKLRSLTQRVAGLRTDIEEASPEKEATKFFLNAPAHLFVSTKLAKNKPQLLESMIVGSYRHHLPGEICKTWPHCSEREETQRPTQAHSWLSLLRWVLRGLTLSLQLFVGVPFAYQRVGLRFAQPVVFSGLALVIYTIFTSVAGLVVIGVCVLAAVAYAVRGWWIIDRLGMAAIAPYTENEVPTFMEDASSSDSSVEVSSEDDTSEEEHLGIEFWNAGFDTGSESESSLEMSAESDDVAELSDDTEHSADQSEYGASEHSFPGYSDSVEEHSGTVGSDGEGLELHHELQESGSGSGSEDVPLSSEPVSWGEASGSEDPHTESDHAGHSDLSSSSMHSEPRQDSYDAEEGPPSEMSGGGSEEELPHSDNQSAGSLEEDSW
jgi:hypothetical protein